MGDVPGPEASQGEEQPSTPVSVGLSRSPQGEDLSSGPEQALPSTEQFIQGNPVPNGSGGNTPPTPPGPVFRGAPAGGRPPGWTPTLAASLAAHEDTPLPAQSGAGGSAPVEVLCDVMEETIEAQILSKQLLGLEKEFKKSYAMWKPTA